MKIVTKLVAAMSCLCALSSSLSAQVQHIDRVATKKALLKEMLKEKLRTPLGNIRVEHGEAEERTTVGYDQRVTTNGSAIGEGEISVAYNPKDSNQLVLSFMQQTASGALSFPIYYSSNGGVTWTKSTFTSTAILSSDFPGSIAAGGGDPAFAWDKNGRLYFAWIYLTYNPSGSSDTAFFTLNWAYSDDTGHTWSVKPKHFIGQGAIDVTTGDTYPYKDGITDREWLAVDNSGGSHQGNVYCSFVCFPAGTASAFEGIKTLVPGIDTFGSMVPGYMGNTQFGNVEVDKNGILHMSFADIDNSQVRHVKSTDGGASFGTSSVVGNASLLFPSGPTYVLHNRENAAVNMAVDGASGSGNNVHVVWSDFPGSTAISCYAHSSDGGATWSTPDTLNKRFGNNVTLMPTVAAEGSNVAISVTAETGADSSWYYQLGSTDNGNTFGGPVVASAAPTRYVANGANQDSSPLFFGDYTRSVRSTCQVYAAWSDGRSNTAKVYFARKNFCTLGMQEVTAVNDNLQLNSVFPNPASNFITLDITASVSQNTTIKLLDLNGKVVAEQKAAVRRGGQQLTMQLNGIAKGAYLLSLSNEGGIVATRTVAVQ